MSRIGKIVVAGAGPVGLAFAAACAEACVVLDRVAARPPSDPDETDIRVFALSAGTRAFLQAIGAWERLPEARMTPVASLAVHGDDGGELYFPAPRGQAAAWIVEGNRLARAVEAAARDRGVEILHDTGIAGVRALARGATVTLDGGEALQAPLLVGADGPGSSVRELLGLNTETTSYGQTAIVAHFRCERPHGGVARKWFGREAYSRGCRCLAIASPSCGRRPMPWRRLSWRWTPSRCRLASVTRGARCWVTSGSKRLLPPFRFGA